MLASIQTIHRIEPHPNADQLEICHILGWKVIARKGVHREGERCIYIETDTVVPQTEEFSFMERVNYRVKPMKLRGLFSEGLCIRDTIGLPVGSDVTEIVGVVKFEKPIPDDGESIGPLPSVVSRTDEIRVQSQLDMLAELKKKEYYVTIKHDGTSATFGKLEGEFYICSRNLRKSIGPGTLFGRIFEKYHLADHLEEGEFIQGEIIGPGIQINPEKLREIEFRMFSWWKNRERLSYPFTKWSHFVPMCELISEPVPLDLNELENLAERTRYSNGARAEGIVVRAIDQSVSFKVLNKQYAMAE
ncbi:RNA ligase family protein [Lacunimicrobium album]